MATVYVCADAWQTCLVYEERQAAGQARPGQARASKHSRLCLYTRLDGINGRLASAHVANAHPMWGIRIKPSSSPSYSTVFVFFF